MKCYYIGFAIFLFLLFACSLPTRDFKKAKAIILTDINSQLVTYTDKETIDLLKRAKRSYDMHLWKGDVKVLVIMNNNDTIELRASRYGGFFRNAKNDKTYAFKKQSDIDQWVKLFGLRIN